LIFEEDGALEGCLSVYSKWIALFVAQTIGSGGYGKSNYEHNRILLNIINQVSDIGYPLQQNN